MAFEQERIWAIRLFVISLTIGMTLFVLGITSESPTVTFSVTTPDSNSSFSSGSPSTLVPIKEMGQASSSIGFFTTSLPRILLWTDYVWVKIFELPGAINIFYYFNLIIVTLGLASFLLTIVAAIRGALGI